MKSAVLFLCTVAIGLGALYRMCVALEADSVAHYRTAFLPAPKVNQ